MQGRIRKLQESMKEKKIEAMLITYPANRRYITGFTGSEGVVLITADEAIFVTDFRYITQVREQVPHVTLVEHQGYAFKTIEEECRSRGVTSLAFEQDDLTYTQFQDLQEALKSIEVRPVCKVIETLRMTKDDAERAIMRKAAEIADEAFSEIVKIIQPGMTEKEVALQLEFLMRKQGASSSSFSIIVASGKRSALPHGIASNKKLENGDLITLDFGAMYEGYASDITRTVILGSANQRQREIYDIVLTAQQRTIDQIRPGMTGMEADSIARSYITECGYGDFFGHGTGHGLGIEVHEDPRLSKQGSMELVPGMVVTVEPGIYIADFGGVRIEDDILITESGCEVFTKSPKELIIIDGIK